MLLMLLLLLLLMLLLLLVLLLLLLPLPLLRASRSNSDGGKLDMYMVTCVNMKAYNSVDAMIWLNLYMGWLAFEIRLNRATTEDTVT